MTEKSKPTLDLHYLQRLAELYPTIAKASTEIINLQSILNLPKGTEHFITDIHGEYEAFSHVLRNGSGAVRRKVNDVFGNTLSSQDKQTLATLIYYPREKMDQILKQVHNKEDWYKITLYRLIEVSKRAASKYTRSKVRKALPKDFAYVIEELITEKAELHDKESYYNEIIQTIIRIGRAEEFICAIADLIQRLVIDHLHIVGDIYDRGPGPHIIMDKLMTYHSVDIQWGNHDVLWMGAEAGKRGCIANVIRSVHTDPDTVYLLDTIIVAPRKFHSFLGRDHPRAIIYAPRWDLIAGIAVLLRFHVYYHLDLFLLPRQIYRKSDVIIDLTFSRHFVFLRSSGDFLRFRCVCHSRRHPYFRYLDIVPDTFFDLCDTHMGEFFY